MSKPISLFQVPFSNTKDPREVGFSFLVLLAIWFFGFAIAVFLITSTVHAQTINVGLEQTQSALGLPATDIRIIVANIIRIALGLLGIVTIGIIMYAGFLYMTAGGDEEQVGKAKDWMKNGVIGLIIIIASFAIVTFVISRLLEGVTGEGSGFGPGGVPIGTPFSGALGNGILRDHYPGRGARDVPRNTMVSVTFKQAILPASVIQDTNGNGVIGDAGDKINLETIKIIRASDVDRAGIGATPVSRFLQDVGAGVTPDHTSFVFRPSAPLGSPSENVGYVVALIGGSSGVKKEDGSAAFPDAGLGTPGYQWDFEVGTTLDLTPPHVVRITPERGEYARNIITQVAFNEAVNPVAVSGMVPGFQNLRLTATPPGSAPHGEFRISNGYRTVEFVPSESCGVNSCGVNMYCLPPRAAVSLQVLAANLTPAGDDGAQAVFPFNGVVDMAGNSLDGDRDGAAEGPPTDSVNGSFSTSDDIDRVPPEVQSISPNIEQGEVAGDAPITATFTKIMRASTIASDHMSLEVQPEYEAWYTIRSDDLDADGNPGDADHPPRQTRATYLHPVLRPTAGGLQYYYFPGMTQGVQDQYQNCLFPGAGPGQDGGRCAVTPPRPYCCNGVAQEGKCAELP